MVESHANPISRRHARHFGGKFGNHVPRDGRSKGRSKNYELKAKIPDNVFLTSHYKSPGVVMGTIYKKSQQFMVDHGLAEGTQKPIAVNQLR